MGNLPVLYKIHAVVVHTSEKVGLQGGMDRYGIPLFPKRKIYILHDFLCIMVAFQEILRIVHQSPEITFKKEFK
jgi:hypothetical protein